MALGGALDHEIADAIKVSVETLRRWRRDRIEFLNGTRVTAEEMAQAARMSLYRRAVGFTYRAEKVFANGRRMKIVENVIPDVTAAIKILQALDPQDVWRDKKDVKSDNAFSWADFVRVSYAERQKEAELAKAKLIEGTPVPEAE
jgi:hypothetical protein